MTPSDLRPSRCVRKKLKKSLTGSIRNIRKNMRGGSFVPGWTEQQQHDNNSLLRMFELIWVYKSRYNVLIQNSLSSVVRFDPKMSHFAGFWHTGEGFYRRGSQRCNLWDERASHHVLITHFGHYVKLTSKCCTVPRGFICFLCRRGVTQEQKKKPCFHLFVH